MIKKLTAFYARLSKRERLILIFTSLVLAALLVDRLVLTPARDQMKLLDTKILDEEKAIKKSLRVLLRKDQVASDVKRYAVFSIDVKKPEEQMTSLLKEIENIADKASVSLLYVKPGSEKEGGDANKYLANLECEGQMEQIITFFYRIENSVGLLGIEKYDIQPKSKDSGTVHCVMTISKMALSRATSS